MEIRFEGHACLTIRGQGLTVVTDPYRPGAFDGRLAHRPLDEPADIVTISHYHVDHSHLDRALGDPAVIDGAAEARGVRFEARAAYHDRHFGAHMGMTTMIVFELEGLRIAHLGDLGAPLDATDLAFLGRPDVLIWPVGGVYTLGPEDAPALLEAVSPRLALPVHYENARCRLGMQPIDALEPHLGRPLTRPGASTWCADDGLPEVAEGAVLVLEPAR